MTFPLDQDPSPQRREPGCRERILETHLVALHDGVSRVHQPVGEVTVRREDHQPLTVLVKASGAEEPEPLKLFGQQVKDGVGIARVVVGADQAAGLVDRERHSGLRRVANLAALRDDAIGRWIDPLPEGCGFAVHPHLACRDERLRRPTGAYTGVGEEFLEADGRVFVHEAGDGRSGRRGKQARGGITENLSRTAPGALLAIHAA